MEATATAMEMPEMQEDTTLKKEKQEASRRSTQVRKDNAVSNHTSIYWLPYSGSHGYKVAKSLRDIDWGINQAQIKAGFKVSVTQVREAKQKVLAIANRVWEVLSQHVPRLHGITVNEYPDLNNTEKEKLMMSKVSYSICILPRSPEVGYLTMGIKQIEEAGRRFQATNLDALDKLTNDYKALYDEIVSLENDLTKTYPFFKRNKK